MKQYFKLSLLFFVILFTQNCYYFQVSTDKDFACLHDEAKIRVNSDIFLNPPALDYEEDISQVITSGLSRDQAVELALKNNKKLLAKLEELGIKKSDYLQASLFTNPTFSGTFRYPKTGPDCFDTESQKVADRETYKDLEFRFELSDLWLLPLRQRVAFDDVKLTFFHLISQAIEIMHNTRRHYDRIMLNEARVIVFKELIQFAKEMIRYFNWRLKNGKKRKIRHSPIYNWHADVELLERKAHSFLYKGNLQAAYANLKESLGLYNIDNKYIKNINKLDNICIKNWPVDELLDIAYRYNPELQIMRVNIQKYFDSVKYEQAGILKEFKLGVSIEKAIDPFNPKEAGPAFDITIPFFDYNQAQVSKALYFLEKAKRDYVALQLDIKAKIYDYHSWISYLVKDLTLRRKKLVPSAIKIRKYAEKYYKTKKISSHAILQAYVAVRRAKQNYLDHFELILNYYEDLEKVLGRRLDLVFDCNKHALIEKIDKDTYKIKNINY